MSPASFLRAGARQALHRHLQSRRELIFHTWYQAPADDPEADRGILYQRLPELCDQVIAACLAEPFDPVRAQAIGLALAGLCVAQPEALGITPTILAQLLIADTPQAGRAAFQRRIAELLGALATGFAPDARLAATPADQHHLPATLRYHRLSYADRTYPGDHLYRRL